ncbi:MAG: hypothetical protein OEY55_12095, partial [Acidimicrobiia bacterium]|nr:hypothetical protein [Acidimicrobiia bacterium]
HGFVARGRPGPARLVGTGCRTDPLTEWTGSTATAVVAAGHRLGFIRSGVHRLASHQTRL